MIKIPTVAIDFRWLDHLSVANGQFRYSVDLIAGLAEQAPEMRFVVLGSKPEPIAEIANVFADAERWTYAGVPRLAGKGSLYREHAQYFRLLRKVKLDVFHALHSFVPLYPPVPIIETVYDLMPELFPEYAAHVQSREYRMHKWAFQRFCTRAIAISRTTADDLAKLWGYSKEKIDIVYLGPRLPKSPSAVAESNKPFILSPYNLEPRKNLSQLLAAAVKLKHRRQNFKLVLFGRAAVDDDRERHFREQVSRLQLDSCIELTGRVSDEQLALLYRTCSVFVFPSLYEGFGLPVLEAMSYGARVLAHQASAMAEVVGEAGYLTDMNDPTTLASAIESAMNDDVIGAKAAERARQFSRERMAQETIAVYRKVLSQ